MSSALGPRAKASQPASFRNLRFTSILACVQGSAPRSVCPCPLCVTCEGSVYTKQGFHRDSRGSRGTTPRNAQKSRLAGRFTIGRHPLPSLLSCTVPRQTSGACARGKNARADGRPRMASEHRASHVVPRCPLFLCTPATHFLCHLAIASVTVCPPGIHAGFAVVPALSVWPSLSSLCCSSL